MDLSVVFPVGHVYLSTVSTSPATLFGFGTWVQRAGGLYLVGQTGVQAGGSQVGSATHSHSFTQPSNHPALTHSGGAVADHTFTQPTAAAEAAHTHGPGTLKDATSSNATKLFTSSTSGVSAATLSGATSAGSSHGHTISGGAVDAHAVTNPSSHAAQSHAGGAVADGATAPPGFVVYVWERTA